MLRGFCDLRKKQNFAPDPLEGLPDHKNPFKNSKKAKNLKNHENQRFSVFSYFPGVGPIGPIFTVWGSPAAVIETEMPE